MTMPKTTLTKIILNDKETEFLNRAIELAKEAKDRKNLPIGAVITLGDDIIAKGKNSIWSPTYRPNRHAEIVALENVQDPEQWRRATEMTIYTTLEPCLMCIGAILVHRIGRVVFGSEDPHGGAFRVLKYRYMPKAFKKLSRPIKWIPAMSQECDKLSEEVIKMAKSHEQEEWGTPSIYNSLIDPNFNMTKFKKSLNAKNSKDLK